MLGDTPHIYRGQQIDPRVIFRSDPHLALTKIVSIPAGYGWLAPGTIMGCISESTTRQGLFVPYAVQAPVAAMAFVPGAYLLQDGAASLEAHVSMEDSYKFAVGDHLGALDSDGAAGAVDLGAITAIDRSTYATKAVITVTNNVTTGITVAKGGMIFIQTDTATPFTTAVGLLMHGVFTGAGENAQGGDGVLVISNAIVRKGVIPNYDAGALADLPFAQVVNNDLIMR